MQGKPGPGSACVRLAFKLSTGGPAVGMAFALCPSVLLKLAEGNLFEEPRQTLVAAYGASFHMTDVLGLLYYVGYCNVCYGLTQHFAFPTV